MKYELTAEEVAEAVGDWLLKRVAINAPHGLDCFHTFKIYAPDDSRRFSCVTEIIIHKGPPPSDDPVVRKKKQ